MPTTKAWCCVVSLVTNHHNFCTKWNYKEPSIWVCWSHNGQVSGEKGFKGLITKMFQKYVRFCQVAFSIQYCGLCTVL